MRRALLAAVLAAAAPCTGATLHFPAADPQVIARRIGPPPASPAQDLASLAAIAASRTDADCAAARAAAELSIFDPFRSVFGNGATAEAFPATTRFIGALVEDSFEVTRVAKARYARPRPNAVDPRIRPCIDQPATSAYPSGHAVFIDTAAEAFAELVPERADAVFAAADAFAQARIIGGIHYPSDAAAARAAAALYYTMAATDPGFAALRDAAARELRAGLRLPPAVPQALP